LSSSDVAFRLEEAILDYAKTYPAEFHFVNQFGKLLAHSDAYKRTHQPGHFTGSAFIVSEDFLQTLLVHHRKLNRWLQPGGHADGDTDLLAVAMREAQEETGLARLSVINPAIYDIDIHPIPIRKDFPAHDHYDVRFLLQASVDDVITVSEESHDVKWISLNDLERYTAGESVLRLRKKIPR